MHPSRLPHNKREALYKKIVKDVEAVEKKHGAEAVTYAINRLRKVRAKERELASRTARLETELAELRKPGAA